jgi:hypothetical protein
LQAAAPRCPKTLCKRLKAALVSDCHILACLLINSGMTRPPSRLLLQVGSETGLRSLAALNHAISALDVSDDIDEQPALPAGSLGVLVQDGLMQVRWISPPLL